CPSLVFNGSFNSSSAANTTWTAPSNTTGVQQTCTIGVVVSDGVGLTQQASFSEIISSVTHTLAIIGGPSGTPNPVASSGPAAMTVTASDSLGHAVSYSWSASCVALSSNGSFDNPSARTPTWTAPTNTTGSPQTCTLRVTVSEGTLTQSGSFV